MKTELFQYFLTKYFDDKGYQQGESGLYKKAKYYPTTTSNEATCNLGKTKTKVNSVVFPIWSVGPREAPGGLQGHCQVLLLKQLCYFFFILTDFNWTYTHHSHVFPCHDLDPSPSRVLSLVHALVRGLYRVLCLCLFPCPCGHHHCHVMRGQMLCIFRGTLVQEVTMSSRK